MANESKTPEELQKEIDSLRVESAKDKERLEKDLKQAIEKRQAAKAEAEELRKQIESSKLTEEQTKILAKYDDEKKTMEAEALSLKNEITKLTETIEANNKRERANLLSAISDEKLKKSLETISDIATLQSIIASLPSPKKIDNAPANIDFTNGDVDIGKLTQAQRLEFAQKYPERYQDSLRQRAKTR